MVQMNFNAQQYQPSTGGSSVVPTGDYDVQIVSSSVKPTKRQDGNMLVFDLRIVAGDHAGKTLTQRLNIQNPNQQAVEIAYGELSAISHVCGKLTWQDTQELHGIPFKVHVEEVPRQDDPSKMGNEIRSYMDASGNPPNAGGGSAPAQPGAPTAPSAPGMGGAPAPAPAAAAAPAQQQASAPAPAPAPAQQQQPQQQQPVPTTNDPAQMQVPSGNPNPTAPAQQTGQAPWQQGAPAPQPAQNQQPAPGGSTPPWAT